MATLSRRVLPGFSLSLGSSVLDLKSGDRDAVAPRRARVFVPDYSI